jgi:hypothetical protein
MEPSPSGPPEIDMSLDSVNAEVETKAAKLRGPVKWCKTCGRKHPRRSPCELTLRTRNAKSGALVTNWTTERLPE